MSLTVEIPRDTFAVREACSVELLLRSSHVLSEGDTVEVQFPHTWSLVNGPSFTRALQTDDPAGEHYVSLDAPGARFALAVNPRQQNHPEGPARHGRVVIATVVEGEVPAGAPIRCRYANTYAPYVSETEAVWVRVRGEAPEALPTLTVTPGPAQSLRVLVPSGADPGEAIPVLVVSLDRFENASSTRYEGETLSLADGTVVAALPSFVGRVRVPVTLPREGVYRFRFRDALSNAVRVAPGSRGPYWGDIHIHTKLSIDGQGTDPYAYARDVSGLDFAGTADHCQSLGPEGYAQTLAWAEDANAPGRFVTVLGDERQPRHFNGSGHYNVYFRDAEAFQAHVGGTPAGTTANLIAPDHHPALDPATVMLVPHHTGIQFGPLPRRGTGGAVVWEAWDDPGLRPVMEVYSHHGQSESYAPQHALAYEFNRLRNPERRSNTSVPGPYYAQDHWMAGRYLGVIASSDEHSGQGGRRHGGIAAVWAGDLTREGIFDAIRARRCYATTGERILLDFTVDGASMGERLQAEAGRALKIRLQVWATNLLVRVEILRHRFGVDAGFAPILAEAPRPEALDAAYELEDEFAGPCLYYARVVQEPLEWPAMAWTSPIWVDAG